MTNSDCDFNDFFDKDKDKDDKDKSRDNVSFSSLEMTELSKRIQTVSRAQEILESAFSGTTSTTTLSLPVICLDQLLPGQRLVGSTTDDTFGQFLGQVGLGGLFVMTSLNHKLRKVRRNGTLCRIGQVDASPESFSFGHEKRRPSAVDFSLEAFHYCRIVDASPTRLGRWRLRYNVDCSEEALLGWGMEHLVEPPSDIWTPTDLSTDESSLSCHDEWSTNQITTGIVDPDQDDPTVRAYGQNVLIPLLEEWQTLATTTTTTSSPGWPASERRRRGDIQRLFLRVLRELGPLPKDNPQALALWGAALLHPTTMPVHLRVAPECRGVVLEAPTSQRRLEILEWAVRRSIAHLNGSAPL